MNGVLLVNKPKGMTSRDVVNKLTRMLGTRKIGHTGTLDPDVDGLLVVCVGKSTKLVQFLTAEEKIYEGTIGVGYSTDTEDASGNTLESKECHELSDDVILGEMKTFLGKHTQTPPMFSAVRVNGKRLYEYAREGIEVERPTRNIEVYSFEKTSDVYYNNNVAYFDFYAEVSTGTFIRTLCVDLGLKLGYPSHMSDLKRTKQGPFLLKDAYTLEQIEEGSFEMLSATEALEHFDSIGIDDELLFRVKNGQKLNKFYDYDGLVVFKHNGVAIAIYETTSEGRVKPVRVL
jgi:tRNA pseudouridine55 synthase